MRLQTRLVLLLVFKTHETLAYWRWWADTDLLWQFVWRPLQAICVRVRWLCLLTLDMLLHLRTLFSSRREEMLRWRRQWIAHIASMLHHPVLRRSVFIIEGLYLHIVILILFGRHQLLWRERNICSVSWMADLVFFDHLWLCRIYVIFFRQSFIWNIVF